MLACLAGAVVPGVPGIGVVPAALPEDVELRICLRASAWLWLMGCLTRELARMRGLYTCGRRHRGVTRQGSATGALPLAVLCLSRCSGGGAGLSAFHRAASGIAETPVLSPPGTTRRRAPCRAEGCRLQCRSVCSGPAA